MKLADSIVCCKFNSWVYNSAFPAYFEVEVLGEINFSQCSAFVNFKVI